MYIHVVKIPLTMTHQSIEYYLKYVSAEKKTRIKKYYNIEDAERAIIADLLTRFVLCTLINCSNQELNTILSAEPNGKPYLVDSEWKFNVSHSGNWVVLAVDVGSIGIDVERMSPIDLDIAKRYFSSYEYSDLMSISPEYRIEHFFRLWTLKEAYIKADGRGLSIPLDSFGFCVRGNEIFFHSFSNTIPMSYFFKQYDLDLEYKLSVCATQPKFPDRFILWDIDDLLYKVNHFLSPLD